MMDDGLIDSIRFSRPSFSLLSLVLWEEGVNGAEDRRRSNSNHISRVSRVDGNNFYENYYSRAFSPKGH